MTAFQKPRQALMIGGPRDGQFHEASGPPGRLLEVAVPRYSASPATIPPGAVGRQAEVPAHHSAPRHRLGEPGGALACQVLTLRIVIPKT